MNEMIKRVASALIAEWHKGNSAYPPDEPENVYFVTEAPNFARAAIAATPEIAEALRQALDALESLRRGHGSEVSGLCYPALSSVRKALIMIDAALAE